MEPNSPRAERAVNTPYDISFVEEEKRTSTGRRGDQYWSIFCLRKALIMTHSREVLSTPIPPPSFLYPKALLTSKKREYLYLENSIIGMNKYFL